MAIIRWEPFGDIDRFFDDFPMVPFQRMGWDGALDLYEEGENIVAELSLPGIDPEKTDVSIEGDVLRISGSREERHEEKQKNYYSKQIRRGSFERTVRLPAHVSEDKVTAEYKDGVLKVVMPKETDQKRGKVKIEVKK